MKKLSWLCLVVCISACGISSPVEPSGESSTEKVSASEGTEEAALLAAAATGDSEIMAATAAATAAACHGTVTCSGYGSCGTWSSASDCGEPYCVVCGKACDLSDPFCERPLATATRTERYRVCFNSVGASCIEWSSGSRTIPGADRPRIRGPR